MHAGSRIFFLAFVRRHSYVAVQTISIAVPIAQRVAQHATSAEAPDCTHSARVNQPECTQAVVFLT